MDGVGVHSGRATNSSPACRCRLGGSGRGLFFGAGRSRGRRAQCRTTIWGLLGVFSQTAQSTSALCFEFNEHMPVGIQVAGPRFADQAVLRLTKWLESAREVDMSWPTDVVAQKIGALDDRTKHTERVGCGPPPTLGWIRLSRWRARAGGAPI